jgi:DNA-binding transcriptional ArsR family regulator
MSAADPRPGLLKLLAEPLRLKVIDRLGHLGPATVSEMAAELDVPLPQLSNHLRKLREAGLVSVERNGRQAIYDLADPGVEVLLPLLDRITGRTAPPPPERPDFADCRTCYRHLAGRLGTVLYDVLVERGALAPQVDGTIELGPEAAPVFKALGVDADRPQGTRKRFAFECLDCTENRPHLAGLMGDRVAETLTGNGWVEHTDEPRVMRITPGGKRGLSRALGVELGSL